MAGVCSLFFPFLVFRLTAILCCSVNARAGILIQFDRFDTTTSPHHRRNSPVAVSTTREENWDVVVVGGGYCESFFFVFCFFESAQINQIIHCFLRKGSHGGSGMWKEKFVGSWEVGWRGYKSNSDSVGGEDTHEEEEKWGCFCVSTTTTTTVRWRLVVVFFLVVFLTVTVLGVGLFRGCLLFSLLIIAV